MGRRSSAAYWTIADELLRISRKPDVADEWCGFLSTKSSSGPWMVDPPTPSSALTRPATNDARTVSTVLRRFHSIGCSPIAPSSSSPISPSCARSCLSCSDWRTNHRTEPTVTTASTGTALHSTSQYAADPHAITPADSTAMLIASTNTHDSPSTTKMRQGYCGLRSAAGRGLCVAWSSSWLLPSLRLSMAAAVSCLRLLVSDDTACSCVSDAIAPVDAGVCPVSVPLLPSRPMAKTVGRAAVEARRWPQTPLAALLSSSESSGASVAWCASRSYRAAASASARTWSRRTMRSNSSKSWCSRPSPSSPPGYMRGSKGT
eukprot:Unigene8530_Nuclearia_a/m.26119 Unigene8530_Nuclearia_a/g.26119  ORF Unigene8530_Nuclearia_a/g.26119 Unigene8530_Nuclearia_a/m.26119 type:complete len:318 (+) Unigene8530_Nuclearia_a:80-1033(+)